MKIKDLKIYNKLKKNSTLCALSLSAVLATTALTGCDSSASATGRDESFFAEYYDYLEREFTLSENNIIEKNKGKFICHMK